MTLEELKDRVGGEWIGGRIVAVVDGVKHYLSDVYESGERSLNDIGLRLQMEFEQAAAAIPKRTRAKKEEVAGDAVTPTDDVEIEV